MPRARSQPRPYHHGNLREALVDAALAILAEEGVAALTLRSAARRVGVSHAAPKNHFGDLRGLLAAVAAEGFRRLAAAMQVPKDEDTAERLLAIGRAYVRFAQTSPELFRAMFHPGLGPREPGGELDQASTAALGVLVEAVATAQAAGTVREGDAMELSMAAWSLVHGLSTLLVDGHLARKGLPRDGFVLARALGEHLLRGVGVDGGRARSEPGARARRKSERA